LQCPRYHVVQAEDGIRDRNVTGVQTCALPISAKFLPVVELNQESPQSRVEPVPLLAGELLVVPPESPRVGIARHQTAQSSARRDVSSSSGSSNGPSSSPCSICSAASRSPACQSFSQNQRCSAGIEVRPRRTTSPSSDKSN